MQNLSKAERRALRELASIAYERELSAELAKLREMFEEWHRGEVDPFELEKAIHVFHNGSARDLFNRYSAGAILEHVVAGAVLRSTLREEEIPVIVRDPIMRLAAMFRDL